MSAAGSAAAPGQAPDRSAAAGDAPSQSRRPLRIGLSACRFGPDPERPVFTGKTLWYVEQSMAHWVALGGALVYPLPPPPEHADDSGAAPLALADVVADLDGLVLHGGSDVSPRSYDEEPLRDEWEGDAVRDAHERALVEQFLRANKSILGICRGHQIINVALGGTLYQDLGHQGATERAHRDPVAYDRNRHDLDVADGSYLADLVGAGRHQVNSVHHQGIKDLAPGLVVEARSADDGVVEAVRLTRDDAPWCLGVQWHPEFVPAPREGLLDDTPVRAAFLAAALARRDASTIDSEEAPCRS